MLGSNWPIYEMWLSMRAITTYTGSMESLFFLISILNSSLVFFMNILRYVLFVQSKMKYIICRVYSYRSK